MATHTLSLSLTLSVSLTAVGHLYQCFCSVLWDGTALCLCCVLHSQHMMSLHCGNPARSGRACIAAAIWRCSSCLWCMQT